MNGLGGVSRPIVDDAHRSSATSTGEADVVKAHSDRSMLA
jgi:hypothetical protein